MSQRPLFNSSSTLSMWALTFFFSLQDQWQRKKQTKDQAREAKRAKLDPDNSKSAKDVLDEQAANARKRKREDDVEFSDLEGVETEKPLSNSVKKGKQTKKQKRLEKGTPSGEAQGKGSKVVRTPEQDEATLKRNKIARKREKKERKKAKEEADTANAKAKRKKKAQQAAPEEDSKEAADTFGGGEDENENATAGDIEPISMDDIMEDLSNHPPSTATPSTNRSPAFDTSENHSGSSSVSSILPPTVPESNSKQEQGSTSVEKSSSAPKPSPEELKARLAQRIEALRAARNPSGDAPKNRQELMEQRRAKEEQRRAHKKDLRRQAKEEEIRQRNETLARGSPLLSGSPMLSPGSPLTPSTDSNSFSFNRVNFADGQHATSNLSAILEPKTKPKGPSDPRTALLAAQNKQSRLHSLDETKRADIAEKDTWLNARKRAHGERIRDDTSLLKKTLKRKEKQKKKSEKEWTERIEGVKKGQDFRQKKREANLQKRKEEKGGKGKNKSKGSAKKGKPKARPGFEGSFRAKAPSAAKAGESGGSGQRKR